MIRTILKLLIGVVVLKKVAVLLSRRSRSEAPSTTRTVDLTGSWSTPLWEPFKIAVAAIYSLCLQRCYETAISVINAAPVRFTSFRHFPELGDVHLILFYQTVGYVIWLSLNFLYNMGLYLFTPPEPTRWRLWVHCHLTASLGVFYLFGATVGKPSHVQLSLILCLLFMDLLFPFLLTGVLSGRVRWTWFTRGCLQFGFVLWIGWQFAENELRNPLFSLVFMILMLTQLLVFTPNDVRRLKRRVEALRSARSVSTPISE